MSKEEIIRAYRKLYRSGLRAVQFSKPARYVVRDQLREAFREKNAQFNAKGIQRTIWFLNAASKERGLEHRILRNLLRTAHMRKEEVRRRSWRMIYRNQPQLPDHIQQTAYDHYEMTIAMLNQSMGLCLR